MIFVCKTADYYTVVKISAPGNTELGHKKTEEGHHGLPE